MIEWIVYSDPIFAPGGFWFCQECHDDAECEMAYIPTPEVKHE